MRRVIILLIISLLVGGCGNITGKTIYDNDPSIEINLPRTYHEVLMGENLWFSTIITGIDESKYESGQLRYDIINDQGYVETTKTESINFKLEKTHTGYINIPQGAAGEKILRVSLILPESSTNTEVAFQVIYEKKEASITRDNSLFDIIIEIPEDYRYVEAGNQLLTSIKLLNMGSSGRVDVFLDFWITDSNDDMILKIKETVAVETQANFVRNFQIPSTIDPGIYHLNAQITYADGKYAAAQHTFEVLRSKKDNGMYIYIIALVYVLMGFLIALVFFIPRSKTKDGFKKMKIRAKVSKIVRQRFKY